MFVRRNIAAEKKEVEAKIKNKDKIAALKKLAETTGNLNNDDSFDELDLSESTKMELFEQQWKYKDNKRKKEK